VARKKVVRAVRKQEKKVEVVAQQQLEDQRKFILEGIIIKMIASQYFTDREMQDVAVEFGMSKFYESLTGVKHGTQNA
jgi:uncharacterized protein (UPF0264 family)